jgi:hypothetical protein
VIRIQRLADKLPLPGPRPASPRLALADLTVSTTQAELRLLSQGARESFAIWAGRPLGDSAMISHVISIECPANRYRLAVPSDSRAELATLLHREKLLAFADLHTHPDEAFLSAADRAEPFSSRPGFYSIVIPRFASGTPGSGWRAYQATEHTWQEVCCCDRFTPWPF